jgi:DNA polymerase-3 subunit gamma/tau
LRERWNDVLEAVSGERRLAWIHLRSANVQGLEGNVLTVGFASEGMAKGFSASGSDQVLAGVLGTMFGLNVRVKAVVGSVSPPATVQAASAPPAAASVPGGSAPAPAQDDHRERPSSRRNAPGADPQAPADRPAAGDAAREAAAPRPRTARGTPARKPAGRGAAPGSGIATGQKSAAGQGAATGRGSDTAQGPAAGGGQRPDRAAAPSGSAFGDEEWPDDAAGPDATAAGGGALTGMELIQRQLGGRVIEEIEEA